MTEFERIATGADRPQGPTVVYITRRVDFKYKAVYCFHAKRITKILTKDKLRAEFESGRYRFVGITQEELNG